MGRRREIRLWVVRAYVGQTCIETVEVRADSRLQACERGREALSEGLDYEYVKSHPYKKDEEQAMANTRVVRLILKPRTVRAHIERFVLTKTVTPAATLLAQSFMEMLVEMTVSDFFHMLIVFHRNNIFSGEQAAIVRGLLEAYPTLERHQVSE